MPMCLSTPALPANAIPPTPQANVLLTPHPSQCPPTPTPLFSVLSPHPQLIEIFCRTPTHTHMYGNQSADTFLNSSGFSVVLMVKAVSLFGSICIDVLL